MSNRAEQLRGTLREYGVSDDIITQCFYSLKWKDKKEIVRLLDAHVASLIVLENSQEKVSWIGFARSRFLRQRINDQRDHIIKLFEALMNNAS